MRLRLRVCMFMCACPCVNMGEGEIHHQQCPSGLAFESCTGIQITHVLGCCLKLKTARQQTCSQSQQKLMSKEHNTHANTRTHMHTHLDGCVGTYAAGFFRWASRRLLAICCNGDQIYDGKNKPRNQRQAPKAPRHSYTKPLTHTHTHTLSLSLSHTHTHNTHTLSLFLSTSLYLFVPLQAGGCSPSPVALSHCQREYERPEQSLSFHLELQPQHIQAGGVSLLL